MKITLLQENIHKVAQDASRFISTKPQLPILSGLFLSTNKGELSIRSTDLRVGFHTKIGGKIEKDGDCVVNAKIFTELLGSLKAGSMTIMLDEGSLHLEQGRMKAKIPTLPAADFPPFPELSNDNYSIPAEKFFSQVEKTTYAASLDETRPVLASALLILEEKKLLVACTDGYRLVVHTSETGITEIDKPVSVLLSAKMLTEVSKALQRGRPQKVDFSLSSELMQVSLLAGETQILMRMTEGNFPPYQQIMPQSFLIRTFIDREEFLQALKTSMVFARESSSIVSFEIGNKQLKIVASGATAGENEIILDSSYEGREIKKISFNAKFVTDALLHIETERVELCMNDELKPVVIFPENSENYQTVIMPFKR